MPVSAYFKGHGKDVLAEMVAKHGKKAGERMFYATANKQHMQPTQGKGSILHGAKG